MGITSLRVNFLITNEKFGLFFGIAVFFQKFYRKNTGVSLRLFINL